MHICMDEVNAFLQLIPMLVNHYHYMIARFLS